MTIYIFLMISSRWRTAGTQTTYESPNCQGPVSNNDQKLILNTCQQSSLNFCQDTTYHFPINGVYTAQL